MREITEKKIIKQPILHLEEYQPLDQSHFLKHSHFKKSMTAMVQKILESSRQLLPSHSEYDRRRKAEFLIVQSKELCFSND